MALLGTINKQVREVGDADISYVTYLSTRAGVIISNNTTEVTPAGLTVSSQIFNDNKIKLTYSAGTDGVIHKITVLATTSEGMVLEDEILVSVKNV